MQSLLQTIFPPQCVSCQDLVQTDFGICGTCWRDTPFIRGTICDACGVPLPGEPTSARELCDDCLSIVRPWDRGRAALVYRGNGKRLVLALKHGDRTDLVRPSAAWMHGAAPALFEGPRPVLVPVPSHPLRLLKRRYNQAALLARGLLRHADAALIPDLLIRTRRTETQDGKSRDARFSNLAAAIEPGRRAAERLAGRRVILIDDVMTSGATLAAATEACRAAGAPAIDVLVLARVAKDA